MKSKSILTKLFADILREFNRMSESDVAKLESGEYLISVKLVKSKSESKNTVKTNVLQKDDILKRLQECKSREEGNELLANSINSKKDLEFLARFLEISVLKQDKADQIREKIIEATIGAILRSNAIQGKME